MSLYGGVELPNRPDPSNIVKLDLLQIPMVRKMQRYGIRIDPDHYAELSSRLGRRMAELKREITAEIPAASLDRFVDATLPLEGNTGEIGDTDEDMPDMSPAYAAYFDVESSQRTAELLYDVLALDRTAGVKVKKTKGGDRLSTGKKTLEQLKREHPVVPLILEYRENAKLKSTYADTMPRHAKFHRSGRDCALCGRHHREDELRVHTQLQTTRAATGRIQSKSPNLANIPARTKLGGEIRCGFVSSKGHVISQRDFAQIELRLMADASGDTKMCSVYEADGDIHLETAMGTFNITDPAKVDKLLHRAPSKNTNFAVAYLISGRGLLDLMAVSFSTANQPLPDYMTERWCEDFISRWFSLYPGVKRYLEAEESKARRYGIVWTRCGRVRRIPQVRSFHSYIQAAGIREGCNHSIQGLSADLMKLAMAELSDRLGQLEEYGIYSYPLLTIYDELLVECEEDDGDTVQAVLADVLDNIMVDKTTGINQCRVPIKSDGCLLKRWTKG